MEKCFGVNISVLDNKYVDVLLQNEFFFFKLLVYVHFCLVPLHSLCESKRK